MFSEFISIVRILPQNMYAFIFLRKEKEILEVEAAVDKICVM